MNGLAELRRMACDQIRAKYPTLPEHAVCSPRFNDKTSNGLTKCIIAYLTLSGAWATRVTTTGQQRNVKRTEVKGSGQSIWIPGTTKRGTADIMAVYQGLHLSIEVKIGRDRQSADQKKVEAQVNAAGGVYYLARDFNSFYDWILTIKKEGPAKEPSKS